MTAHQHLRRAMDLPSMVPGWLREPASGDVADRRSRPRTARDWIVDLACVVTSLASGAAILRSGNDSVLPLPLDAANVLGSSLLLWWRLRWPVAGALVATVGYTFSTSALLPWHLLLFTVAVHRRARLAVLIATLHLGVSTAMNYDEPHQRLPWWSYELFSLGVIVIVIVPGLLVRGRRRSLRAWRDRASRAEQQRHERMNQARQVERTRIAREMHDVLGHRLSLLAVHAGALECRPDADSHQITTTAGVIRDNAHQALEELRDVIGVLSEDDADGGTAGPGRPQPGLDAIPALIAESTRAGARIRYHDDGPGTTDRERVSPTIARTAYRVVQEGLTNARKHAPGTAVDVTVTTGAHELVVEVSNPLPLQPPRHPVPGSGMGLVGLGERVQLAGGRLAHRTTSDGVFVLRAELPRHRST